MLDREKLMNEGHLVINPLQFIPQLNDLELLINNEIWVDNPDLKKDAWEDLKEIKSKLGG